jgi:nucleoside-diphosphate-sugar epimerase
MNSKIKILITGYNGYIGKSFVKFLKKKKIKFEKLDLKKKINYKNFTHLLHLKFDIKEKKIYLKRNIEVMNRIIKICQKHKLFLIFPSTASFDFRRKKKINNNIKIINYYTQAKSECEKLILSANKSKYINFTILRIFNVYGDNYENRYYISKIIRNFKKAKKFEKINIKFSENVRDYINISDLNTLLLKVIRKKNNGIFEVGSGKSLTIKNLSIIINKIFKKKNKLIFMSPKKSVKNFFSRSNIKNTKKVFNWSPRVKLTNGLKKLICK